MGILLLIFNCSGYDQFICIIVLKSLRYELGAEKVINGQGDDPNDPILLHDMECHGTENHISECDFGDHAAHNHPCTGNEHAGLKCRRAVKSCDEDHEYHCANKECININNLCDGKFHCADGSDEDITMCSVPLQVRLVLILLKSNSCKMLQTQDDLTAYLLS